MYEIKPGTFQDTPTFRDNATFPNLHVFVFILSLVVLVVCQSLQVS